MAMANRIIEDTLVLIRDQLEEALQNSADPRRDQPWVSLSNVIDVNGKPYDQAKQSVVMFLANITRENTISTYAPTVPSRDGTAYVAVAPPIYVDLHLIFYANFEGDDYLDGLRMISEVISFFQQNHRVSRESLPGLPEPIEQLTFDLTNLDSTDLSYLMGLMGTKYLPTVYYKVRLIPFDGRAMQAEIPAARGVEGPTSAPLPPVQDDSAAGPRSTR